MITAEKIEKIVYDLCLKANTELDKSSYEKILLAWKNETSPGAKQALALILKNAQLSFEKKMPLCQDTGQVIVFAKAKSFTPDFNSAVNNGVQKAYEENFFRKSVVKNALFDRVNTKTNTPCVIYTEISPDAELEIELLIKGAGSENVSQIKMLSPTASQDEIKDFVVDAVAKAGSKACPPYFIGIGIGGTIEYAGMLSKKALLLKNNPDEQHNSLAEKIKNAANELCIGAAGFAGGATVLDVKILSDFTHIACMPTAVTINCHSSRHARYPEEKILEKPQFLDFNIENSFSDYIKLNTEEFDKIKNLKKGQKVLLSGEIYTARDAAHKRLVEMIDKNEELPFEIKNKIIFYAGPCPCSENCIVGSIGPTTSARMDKFLPKLLEKGLLATIGKGERTQEATEILKKHNSTYFTMIGGIACYLAEKFTKKEIIAFEDLGAEAIYKFKIENLPLTVA